MNLKTKIFTLIVAGLLIVPVLFNPPKSNSVLGVSEKTTPTSSTKTASSSSTSSNTSTSSTQPKTATAPKTSSSTGSTSSSSSSNSSTPSNNTSSSTGTSKTSSPSTSTQSQSASESESSNKNNSFLPNIGLPKINLNLGNIFSRDNTSDNQPKPRSFPIKDITSGVREKVDNEPTILSGDNPEARGYIQWEPSATTSIISNKYQLGASIKVNTSSQTGVDLVISKVQALPVDTILVVDQNTFIKLGGKPQTQKEILETISKTN